MDWIENLECSHGYLIGLITKFQLSSHYLWYQMLLKFEKTEKLNQNQPHTQKAPVKLIKTF